MTIANQGCQVDSDCPWLFLCNNILMCEHVPMPYWSLYTIFIYLLIPFASGLVNLTGNSMGVFKVLIMMNLLRYQVDQSTALIQPMVAGTALPNFVTLISKKHPNNMTSLVNFSLVYILIPACLYGSTIGTLLQSFVPKLFQDILIVVVFSYFAYNFVMKAKNFKETGIKTSTNESINNQKNLSASQIQQNLLVNSENHQDQSHQIQVNKLIKYQKGMHIPEILISFVVFIVFQFLVFLVQGKLSFVKFSQCSLLYLFGLISLGIVVAGYLYIIKIKTNSKFVMYNKANFPQDVNLDENKNFIFIVAGGLVAGLMQGILGVGSGTCMMAVLVAIGLPPRVASATSGYQVFFIGSASFIEGLINESIKGQQIIFLMGVCAILGGILTIIFYQIVKKYNQQKVNRILLYVICVLCIISVVGIIPSAITTVLEFGFNEMMKIKWQC